MHSPAISVIVPVYNVEVYLERCIRSLVGQSFRDFEMIFVDDGSTDGSPAILDKWGGEDSRIRVFHKENGGVSSAREYGLERARGEYLIHCDPDDYVDEKFLEAPYRKAVESGADMVICDFVWERKNEEPFVASQKPSAKSPSCVLQDMLENRIWVATWNDLIKRSCFTSAGVHFPEGINYAEDLLTYVELLRKSVRSVEYLPEAHYHYCYRGGSLTSDGGNTEQMLKFCGKLGVYALEERDAEIERSFYTKMAGTIQMCAWRSPNFPGSYYRALLGRYWWKMLLHSKRRLSTRVFSSLSCLGLPVIPRMVYRVYFSLKRICKI